MQQSIPWEKIESLQKEIDQLKALGKKKVAKKTGKKNSLRGILKGVEFTDEDFEEVKKMWFDEAHLLYQKHKK